MIITVDIGNSNTVIVGYETNEGLNLRFETAKSHAQVYYEHKFSLLQHCNPQAIIISCVVPRIQEAVALAVQTVFGFEPIFIDSKTVAGFKIHLDNPLEIGADFIATSLGVIHKYPLPCIVVDLGSATKLTYVDAESSFGGGVIVPGFGTSLDAMYQFIPHLPKVDLTIPPHVIGNSTTSAIQAGILYGLKAQIEGLSELMEHEIGVECAKVITGGYAAIIAENLDGFIYDSNLLNDGLYEIYKREVNHEN